MSKMRQYLRAVAGASALLLLLLTIASYLYAAMSQGGSSTSSARDPWLKVSADGEVSINAEECLSYERLVIPEVVNDITVTGFTCSTERPADWVESITLPKTLRRMSDFPLHNWDGLREIVIEEGIKDMSNVWLGTKPKLEKLVIPASVTSMREGTLLETPEGLTVYYGGTEEAWLSMGNAAKMISEKYTVVFESDGEEHVVDFDGEGS